jgi:hypothetical protein
LADGTTRTLSLCQQNMKKYTMFLKFNIADSTGICVVKATHHPMA